jgi:hypothetical protein
MGSKFSRSNQYKREEDSLEIIAARNYHRRVREYDYAYHGYYLDYIEWCRAQYELECIPKECRQGSRYTPEYDHWGNQIG